MSSCQIWNITENHDKQSVQVITITNLNLLKIDIRLEREIK